MQTESRWPISIIVNPDKDLTLPQPNVNPGSSISRQQTRLMHLLSTARRNVAGLARRELGASTSRRAVLMLFFVRGHLNVLPTQE